MIQQDYQQIERKEKNDDNEKVLAKSKEFFGFKTIRLKKKWNLCKCLKRNQKKGVKKEQQENQQQINNQIDFYEELSLNECYVNIFAMKEFIKNNFKSLRTIEIIKCFFYLSDEDAEKQQFQEKNQRMFQELKFDWLIEQFKFKNIQTITIDLSEDPQIKKDKKGKEQKRDIKNQENVYISSYQQSEQEKIEILNSLCRLFDCEQDSEFINYETQELEKFLQEYTGEKLDNRVKRIIWGDIQDKKKSKEKLYKDIIFDIQYNLRIFKKYTQHALQDNMLIIIGDVLYNGQSLKQLYNLIQLNCENIQGIIFKDNGKIPPKVFSNLMKQIFLIPKIKQISFLSSVLHEQSLIGLQYLIQEKNVQYLILFRSYFLRHEFDKLLNFKSEQIYQINHQMFVIIDIQGQQAYQFTPYTDFIHKYGQVEENMLLIEIIYKKQQEYDQKIQNQIQYFFGKNLSIMNKNESEKILFENWNFLNLTKENQKLEFQERQDVLIKILDSQFREDDINILNYSLINTLIENVIDNEKKKYFRETLMNSKSYQFLNEKIPIKIAEKISFEKESYLQACYSYLYGFTTIKYISIYYIFNNGQLYKDIRENKKKSLLEVQGLELCFRMLNVDIQERKPFIKQFKLIVDFNKLVDLKIQGNQIPYQNFDFLNEIFKECFYLKKFSLSSNMLSDKTLKGVKFSLISNELEEFDINHNTNISNMSFLNDLFQQATKLKKLGLKQVQLTNWKVKTIKFQSLSDTLRELDISFNEIESINFLNTIFQKIPNLQKIDMTRCSLNDDMLIKIQFAPGLKEIIMDDNINLNLDYLIIQIGSTHKMKLEYFSALNISVQGQTLGFCDQYYGKLKAFSNLKKLHFMLNDFSDESYVNLILSNNQFGHTDLIMRYAGLNERHFEKLLNNYFQNLQILDLSGCHRFKNFRFLQQLFKKATQLQSLNLSESRITNDKLCDVDIVDISESLKEFYFSYNYEYNNINTLLNKILPRCQNLLILHLENCNLNEEEMKKTKWEQISTKLKDLNIANNPEIKTYNFINNIIQERATRLQKLNLSYNQAREALNQIKFDLLYHTIIEFITDDDSFYNKEFQNYLINKFEGYVNLYLFQKKYSQIKNDQIIYYFNKFNIQNEKIDDKNENVGELEDFNKYNQKKQKSIQKQNSKEEDKQNEQNKKVYNSKNIKYSQHINPLYFNIFFPERNQDQDQNLGQIKNQKQEIQLQQFRKNQNVFDENSQATQISKKIEIVFSNMDLQFDKIIKDSFYFSFLIEVSFTGNKYTDKNIFIYLNNILEKAQILQKLNLSNMNMREENICNFELVSETLLELNISENKHIKDLSVLNGLFQRCQKLLVLNISKTGLNRKKLQSTKFEYISKELLKFNCSNNQLDVVDFINTIIQHCQKIVLLNLSNCKIDNQLNDQIKYDQIAFTLQELDISKNEILLNVLILNDLLKRCQSLNQIDIRGIVDLIDNRTHIGQFINHSLKNLKISGNLLVDHNFISQLIKNSNKFHNLTIQKVSIFQQNYDNSIFQKIISLNKNYDITPFHFEDMTSITFLKDPPDFSLFISKQESLDKLSIDKVFQNLIKLDLSGCSKKAFVFLDKIFLSHIKLEELNLSGMKIDYYKISLVDFQNTPNTLKVLDLSYNDQINDFKFLNDIFKATQMSLISLNLSQCGLIQEKLVNVDFSLLNQKIKEINLEANENLDNINFLEKLFDKDVSNLMLKIPKFSFDIFYFLQTHNDKIKEINSNFSIDFEFFSQKKFVVNINITYFVKYIFNTNAEVKSVGDVKSSQQLQETKDPKKLLIMEFLRHMIEKKSQKKSLLTIQHFFFLLYNELKIQSYIYYSQDFILSPYFLFQQPQDIQFEYSEKKEINSLMDSYDLAFFKLNLLKKRKKINYIFGYDKFFFPDIPDFYVQNLKNNESELQFIIDLKDKMKKNKISQAFLPIRLKLTQEIIKNKKLNEYEVLKLINSIPPAEINLKGMSIQFVKSWYVINFYSPLSVQTLIDVDYSLIENSSIADFLEYHSYNLFIQNFTGTSLSEKIKSGLGNFLYKFFHLLCSEPKKFAFDHTVIILENEIKKKLDKKRYNVLRVLFPLYIFICIFGICFFSFDLEITCGNGVSWYSYITYGFFGFLTFIIEAIIFSKCLKHVSHLIPELKPNCLQSFPYPLINSIKLFILDINWLNQWYINYFVSFVLSQISRLDFFTNIAFLYTTYQCGDLLVFTLGLIFLSVTTFIWIVFFIINVKDGYSNSHLVTGNIDKLYHICNLLEFQAVADILDIISPSNSIIIFGKMFNQRIVNNFIRILCQDIPFILIQVFYLLRKGVFNETIIFSIASSSVMFLVSLNHFLTITPSRLDQEDFNQMISIKKERKILHNYLKNLSQYELQILKFNQNELFKCIRSYNYFEKILKNQGIQNDLVKNQLFLAQKLRDYYPNKQYLDQFFKNDIINNEYQKKQDDDIIIDKQIEYIKKQLNNHETYDKSKEKNQIIKVSKVNKYDYFSTIIKKITRSSKQSSRISLTKITPIGFETQNSKSFLLPDDGIDKENK